MVEGTTAKGQAPSGKRCALEVIGQHKLVLTRMDADEHE